MESLKLNDPTCQRKVVKILFGRDKKVLGTLWLAPVVFVQTTGQK